MVNTNPGDRNSVRSNQANKMIEIEKFVKGLVENNAYSVSGDVAKHRARCDRVLRELPGLLALYEPDHEYCEHVDAFWFACEKIGLISSGKLSPAAQQIFSMHGVDSVSIIEPLIDWILHDANGQYFRRRAADRRYEQKEKRKRLDAYIRSVLSQYARALVLRVDFGYCKDAWVDIVDVYHHLDRFIDVIRHRQGVFENTIGYAWCIEQGEKKGYHIHFTLILPGHLHQRDGYLANVLGDEWRRASDGLGIFHSCNANKRRYQVRGICGVGMIRRDAEDEIENAVDAIGYLAEPEKEDQYLRMKPHGRRAYATGGMPRGMRKAS